MQVGKPRLASDSAHSQGSRGSTCTMCIALDSFYHRLSNDSLDRMPEAQEKNKIK